jgi:uncharacterized protein YwqG
MTAAEIRVAAVAAELGARADAIVSAALPAIRLHPTPTARTLPEGASRFGGTPDLAPGQSWPSTTHGPLAFVAQIDLASIRECAASRELPETGLLSFFFDAAQEHWGFDPRDAGHSVVLYSRSGPYRRPTPPPDLIAEGTFVQCGITYHEGLTLPPPDSTAFTELGFSSEERERYFNLIDAIREHESFEVEERSWLLGYPDQVQGNMQEECALVTGGLYCGDGPPITDPRHRILARRAVEWRLLLQVGSEEAAGMMWGDLGSLYYWIRHDDLAAGRFDASWTILQCF